jgi:hypothetical protein
MFAHLVFPARPSENAWFAALCCAAAVCLLPACLLYIIQPQGFAPHPAQFSSPEHVFPQAFIHAVPEVGFMSEVQVSGPSLRAVAATWPVGAFAAALPETAQSDGVAAYGPLPDAGVTAVQRVPDPESAGQ